MTQPVYDFDLVCIGSGPAGQRAAVQAAKIGKRVAVVERSKAMGGGCLQTGTIPSKTLREAILGIHLRQHNGASPVTAQRPTAAALLERVNDVVCREQAVVEHQLHRNDIATLYGDASFVDPHTIEIRAADNTRRVSAAHVLVACGTQPTPPPWVQPDGETILLSDDVMRLQQLPRSLTVIGAGVIGIEYASMFAQIGLDVTLIDQRSRPLEFMDHEIVDELIHQMRKRRVTFRLGEAVTSISVVTEPHRRAVIELESGKRIVSEVALFSVGRRGATDGLMLANAGLTADNRGRIAVDDTYRTAVPHIMAAGDVIGFPSLAATSSEQGRLASCFAFDVPARPMAPHFPIGIYAIPEMSMVGSTEHTLTSERVPYEVGLARYREIARGQIVGDDSGLFKMIFHRQTRKLLGAHAIGTGATELIHIGQAVLALGGTLDYFLETVFNYPTLAECYKIAALDASNKLAL